MRLIATLWVIRWRSKSKCILFNSARKFDFKSELYFDNSDQIKIVENTKLLGVEIQSNLKWDLNTDYICTRAYSRIWMIRRLKTLGATAEELTDVYTKQVWCVLELAVSVWSPGITAGQVAQIERVQKTACAVMLGASYIDYSHALSMLNLDLLSVRKEPLCLRFARKCAKSGKYQDWFVERKGDQVGIQTRSIKTDLIPVHTIMMRYERSPLPYPWMLLERQGNLK